MNICEPFRQTAGDIAKICDANFHHRLVLNIGEAIPWYLCMFLSFSCEWRSSVVQARMCKLGRDPLIFLKILVVIGHVCIYLSKVAEGFSVFNAVLLYIALGLVLPSLYLVQYCCHQNWISITNSQVGTIFLISSRLIAVKHICVRKNRSSLVPIMVCLLFRAKPLSKITSVYCLFHIWEEL